MSANQFVFGKADDEGLPELPLLQLSSKFSVNSQINPVRGLEMKRMISVNQQDGTAEPYIDLSSNYIYSCNQQQQAQQQQQQQQLISQPSFMLDLNAQQSNSGVNYYTKYTNYDILMQQQQQQLVNNVNGNNQLTVQQLNNNGNPSNPQNYPFLDQSFSNTFNQAQRQNVQNYFANAATQQSQPQTNFFGNVLGAVQASNSNLIFTNPDLLGNTNNNNIGTSQSKNSSIQQQYVNNLSNHSGFQNSLKNPQQQTQKFQVQQQNQQQQLQQQQLLQQQQQQLNPNMLGLFVEKKEEFDQDQIGVISSSNLNSNTNIIHNQNNLNMFQDINLQQMNQIINNSNSILLNSNNNGNNNNNNGNILMQMPNNIQQFMNMDEAEYIDEARSNQGEDDLPRFGNNHDLNHIHNHHHHPNNHNRNQLHNNRNNNNNANGDEDDQEEYSDDLERYSHNNDSHTRHKTEWPTRPKGVAKYQQCRHRNIFKNFGNIFRKFVSFHNHFTEKVLVGLNNSDENMKLFQKWLKKDIRLENKKDFIEGWTIWKDEEPLIRQFKIVLKELSRDFFQDFILIYLLNSKLQDLEIHLRSIGPCLAAINQPNVLYKFRPI